MTIIKPAPTSESVLNRAGWLRNGRTVLSLPFDDLSQDLGLEIYERMMRNPQVHAKINVLRTWVTSDGLTLTPFVTDRLADGYDQAAELVGWCERVIDDLDTSIDDVFYDMLSALAFGNRVAEIVSAYDSTYTGQTQIVMRRLNVKPIRMVQYVVDEYNNVIGIQGQTSNTEQRIIDRNKFFIWAFRPRDNDPRGTSLLRPAYNAWNMFQSALPEYYKFLMQFASPSLVGTLPDQAQPREELNAYGLPTGNMIDPDVAMLNQLLEFQNGTAVALPYGATLKALELAGDGEAFINAFRFFNNEISNAITSQILGTEEGSFGSRAQASVHQQVIEESIRQIKKSLCRAFRRDALYESVLLNFGPDIAALTPLVSLGDTQQRDWAAEIRAAGAVGYRLATSQLTTLDNRFSLPPRTPEELEQEQEPEAPSGIDEESIDTEQETISDDTNQEEQDTARL